MAISARYNWPLCLNLLYIFFTFCVQCLLGTHRPPECTCAHELGSCPSLLEVFLLKCWRLRLVRLTWVYLSLQAVYCMLYFSNNPTEKKIRCCYVRRTRRPHITKTSNHPLRRQTAKRSHTNNCRVGRSTTLLKPQVMVWWKLSG
jgi:hypothetical protein